MMGVLGTAQGDSAFENSRIVRLAIPASVTGIQPNAFSKTSALKEVTFGRGSQLKLVDNGFFEDSGITRITLPPSLEAIGNGAFRNSGALHTVIFLGNEPSSVGFNAFNGVKLGATARVKRTLTEEFTVGGDGLWNGLKVSRVLR
jgi:hypothetical protein